MPNVKNSRTLSQKVELRIDKVKNTIKGLF